MRTKKAMYNMLSSFFYQIIAIICGLITPRLILANFGSTYNGVVSSATQFLNLINILTLGITASTRVALYKPLSEKDNLHISRLLKATKLYMRRIARILIIYIAILCIVYPFISHNSLTALQSAALIAIVGIGTFADYYFGISNITLLQADQASYVINTLCILKTIVNTILVALLISLGCSIYTVKLGSSVVYFITPLIMDVYVKKKYHIVDDCTPDETGIKQRGAVAFHSISNIVHENTDLVVLTLLTDAKLISVYTVYYLVIGKVKSVMQILTTGMEAAFGDMWVKKEIKTLNISFSAFEYMLFSFATIVFSCVGILILPFIENYTRGITDINYVRQSFAVLLTVAESLYCIRQPYLTLVYSTGSFEDTKNGAAVEAAINVILSFSLVPFLGLEGVIIGTLVANIFRTTQFAIYVSNNILHRSLLVIVKRFLWVIVTSIIIICSSSIILSVFSFDISWTSWLFQAMITFIISCIVTIIMSYVFYRKDLTYVLGKIVSVVRK